MSKRSEEEKVMKMPKCPKCGESPIYYNEYFVGEHVYETDEQGRLIKRGFDRSRLIVLIRIIVKFRG
jgi:hypothetical protein